MRSAATPLLASAKRFAPYGGRLHEDGFVGALLLVFTRLLETMHDAEVIARP
jgi:hypothetical protein